MSGLRVASIWCVLMTRGEGIASINSGVIRLSSTKFLGIGILSQSLTNLPLVKLRFKKGGTCVLKSIVDY